MKVSLFFILSFIFLIGIANAACPDGFGYCNPNLPKMNAVITTPTNYSSVGVNDTRCWQGYCTVANFGVGTVTVTANGFVFGTGGISTSETGQYWTIGSNALAGRYFGDGGSTITGDIGNFTTGKFNKGFSLGGSTIDANVKTDGTVQGLTVTDGLLTINSGGITGGVSAFFSGQVRGGTLTDGTCSINSGAITGCASAIFSGAGTFNTITANNICYTNATGCNASLVNSDINHAWVNNSNTFNKSQIIEGNLNVTDGLRVKGGTNITGDTKITGGVNIYQTGDYNYGTNTFALFGFDDLVGSHFDFGIDQYGHFRAVFNGGIAKYMDFSTANGDINFGTGGTNRVVNFQSGATGPAYFFSASTTGETQNMSVFGYPSGQSLQSGSMSIVAGATKPKLQIKSSTGDMELISNVNVSGNLWVGGNVSFKRPYGMYSSNITQVVSAANTGYAVSFNNEEDAYEVYHNSALNYTNFTFGQTGDFLIEISALFSSSVANKDVQIWMKKNGVNVVRSNTKVEIAGTGEQVIAVPFIIDVNTTDIISLWWAVESTGVSMLYVTNTSYSPEVPSIIMTISKVSEITP